MRVQTAFHGKMRMPLNIAIILVALITTTMCGAAERRSAHVTIDFNRDIRPILAGKCLACHGPDATAKKIGLRLDSAAAATADLGQGRRAIVPGQPQQSETETSKSERESPDEKSTAAKRKEPAKPDLTFMVTLPERINDNSEFTKLLEDSGAKYDFSVQADPTLWVFGVSTVVLVVLLVSFWMWLRKQQNQMLGGGFGARFGSSRQL